MAVAARSSSEELAGLLRRLDDDFPLYAEECLKIVNKRRELVPFALNEPQLELEERVRVEQTEQGKPIRVIILKSRQIGFSTWSQGKLIQRATRKPNRNALVVALDTSTAGALWSMGERMYSHLPNIPGLKPPVTSLRRGKYIHWGEPGKMLSQAGAMGIDSRYTADTANEVEAGRGFTFSDVHLSEVAFWERPDKMTAILNTVPDVPDSMVILESTANGGNFFKHWWERAERGESEYIPYFCGWHRDPTCTKAFLTEADREDFIADIGNGPYGEAEPQLMSLFDCSPEQLNWRRATIADKTQGRVELFNQEYPSTAEEAFILSGAHVFSTFYIQAAIEEARRAQEPEKGILKVTEQSEGMRARTGTVDVPTALEFVNRWDAGVGPNHPLWHVWEQPDPDDDYVVAMDPMGGEVNAEGELAYHAIQVISHRRRVQVARWRARLDADLAGMQALYAAIFYGRAWLAIETTGGWGGAIARRLYEDFKYPYVFRRKRVEKLTERREKVVGWDTNLQTKPWLEESMTEMLREGTHGIRDILTALELSTYVRDEKGKTGPSEGAFSDALMAYMIAQFIAGTQPMKRRDA